MVKEFDHPWSQHGFSYIKLEEGDLYVKDEERKMIYIKSKATINLENFRSFSYSCTDLSANLEEKIQVYAPLYNILPTIPKWNVYSYASRTRGESKVIN